LVPYAPHAKVVACWGLLRSSNESSAGSLLIGRSELHRSRLPIIPIAITYYTRSTSPMWEGVNSGDQLRPHDHTLHHIQMTHQG